MARHNANPNAVQALQRKLASSDAAVVDELYGLEPVFDPAAQTPTSALGDFVELQCPYCGEVYGIHIDLTDGSRQYIEDCQVCCQPIQVTLDVNDAGELLAVDAMRLEA